MKCEIHDYKMTRVTQLDTYIKKDGTTGYRDTGRIVKEYCPVCFKEAGGNIHIPNPVT